MEVRPDIKIVVVASSPAEDPALLAMAGPRPGEVGQGAVKVEAGDKQLGREERCPASGDEETWGGDGEEGRTCLA